MVAKRTPLDSQGTVSGRDLLDLVRDRGPTFEASTLDEMERVDKNDRPPRDKWGET